MSFDAPGALWLLGALPLIVVLWLLRPRRARVRIPSVLLWPSSSAERRSATPWQRLRNHPLLWLQLLVAALLAIAAAQPFLPADVAEQQLIVLLDASGSMQATDVAPSRWDAARTAVENLASQLGPDQRMSVIRVDDQPRTLIADTRDASAVRAALEAEEPAYGPLDAATATSLATGLARGAPSEWVLVGDGDFGGANVPADTVFRFIPVATSTAGNVAITSLSLRPSSSAMAAQVGIRNNSDAAASGSVQILTDAGAVVATTAWQADAWQDTYVGFDGLQPGPSWFEARLSNLTPSDANALATDDRAWAVPPSATDLQQRALLVTTGNTFLERMLAVDGSLRTFKVPPSDWPALVNQGGAAGYSLVVLDRQPRATTPPPPGGSALYIGGGDGDSFQPQLIEPVPDHPLLRNVDWSDVRVGRAARLASDDLAGWQPIVNSDGGPLLLIRSVRDGSTLRREALLTFELGESDLPLRSAFPVLMANLLDWLAPRPAASPRSVSPGTTLQLDASPLAQRLQVGSDVLAPPWPARPFRPGAPGVYRLAEDDPDGTVTTNVVADAFAPSEADVRLRQPTVATPQADSGAANVLRSVRSGVWPWLLAVLLGLAGLEWVVDSRGR